MAWIRTIEYGESDETLRREYDKAVRRAGRVFNIVKIMGLRPAHLQASMDLYLAVMHGPSSLTRARREMLAVVVSKANQCHY
ncbi:MAG: carboxymuconolactone decarboxylase family protein [Acidobacteria bacterium]|nr:carboxymuconolactone decarboxylase family protein [Acidobacteriota bacterium]